MEQAPARCVPILAMDPNFTLGGDSALDSMLWVPQAEVLPVPTCCGNPGGSSTVDYTAIFEGWCPGVQAVLPVYAEACLLQLIPHWDH